MYNQVSTSEKKSISVRMIRVAELVENIHQCTSCPWFVTLHRKASGNSRSVFDTTELWIAY